MPLGTQDAMRTPHRATVLKRTSPLCSLDTPRSDGAEVPSAGCLVRRVRNLGMDGMQPR